MLGSQRPPGLKPLPSIRTPPPAPHQPNPNHKTRSLGFSPGKPSSPQPPTPNRNPGIPDTVDKSRFSTSNRLQFIEYRGIFLSVGPGESLVITHETRRAWRPLRRVFGLCRASVCDSGLKGRFPVAQGAALGLGLPPKFVFRSEGPISKRVWLRGHARRSRCLRTRLC